jgi:hypothetical protein
MSTPCVDEEVASIIPQINEFWSQLPQRDQGPQVRARLAETADSIAAELDDLAAFYRQRAEFLRSSR